MEKKFEKVENFHQKDFIAQNFTKANSRKPKKLALKIFFGPKLPEEEFWSPKLTEKNSRKQKISPEKILKRKTFLTQF